MDSSQIGQRTRTSLVGSPAVDQEVALSRHLVVVHPEALLAACPVGVAGVALVGAALS